jgi:hypothetical protein
MQSFFTFAVLPDYNIGVAFDNCVSVYGNSCHGISTDAESRTPLMRFLYGKSCQSVASPAMGHRGSCPHKLEKAKKLTDEIIMQSNETMHNRCYI